MGKLMRRAGLILVGLVGGILISLQFSAMAEKEVQGSLPVEELRTFAEIFNAIKRGYVEPVEDKKLITHAISGMLSNLDPHSAYLDEEAFKDLQTATQGEFGGLGLEVGMEEGLVKVISPIEDTPADRAGVKAGDLIYKLDDKLVKGMTLTEAVKRMRGKPETRIKLSIIRKGETQPVEITLTREVIKVQSVKSKRVDENYGYLRITSFQENTAPSVVKHLNDLYAPGSLNGLVLDLRNNPGGLLHSAIGVSAAFLPYGTLVTSTDGRVPDAKHQYYANSEDYLRGGEEDFIRRIPVEALKVPIVVLINGGSASASEIVAGALQDHKRAVVMGVTSFGKGSVQTVIPLPGDAAIKLTTARYFTPSGRSIQAKGIDPDIVVEETPGGVSAARLRESDLENHLLNSKDGEREKEKGAASAGPEEAKTPAKPKTAPGKGAGEDEDDEGFEPPGRELASKKDYQLNQAINLLKGLQIIRGR
ncbi:MAG: S41 family peptidase [Candidatus Accumulibacter sp.]|jgi:carboxyl-terminal processing protease|nr:S41 family peptidase [Accumulibacter sp.]